MNVQKMVLVPLRKYERMKECRELQQQQRESEVTIPFQHIVKEVEEEDNDVEEDRLNIETIMQAIPKMYSNKGRAILGFMEKGNALKWNKHGEIIHNGNVIRNSHIADLLKDAMREYKGFSPVGKEEFYQGLAESNVPLLLLENKRNRQHVQEARQPRGKKCKLETRGSGWIHI